MLAVSSRFTGQSLKHDVCSVLSQLQVGFTIILDNISRQIQFVTSDSLSLVPKYAVHLWNVYFTKQNLKSKLGRKAACIRLVRETPTSDAAVQIYVLQLLVSLVAHVETQQHFYYLILYYLILTLPFSTLGGAQASLDQFNSCKYLNFLKLDSW